MRLSAAVYGLSLTFSVALIFLECISFKIREMNASYGPRNSKVLPCNFLIFSYPDLPRLLVKLYGRIWI